MKKRIFSFIPLICFFWINALLHAADLDEIKQELADQPDNEAKIALLIDASRQVNKDHPREAIDFAKEALELAQKLRSKDGVVRAHSNIGLVYMNQDKYTLARESLAKAIDLKEQLVRENPSYKASMAKDYRLLGICYDKQKQSEKSISYIQQGISLALEARDKEEIAQGYNDLGEVQVKLENFQGALMAFARALPIAKQAGNRKLINDIEQNQATSYTLLKNYMEKQEVQLTLEEFEEQIETIKDSLEKEQEFKQILVSEKQLLEMEKAKKEAELQAATSDIELKDAELRAKEADQRNYFIGGAGAALLFLLIIIGLISRSRAKTRYNQEIKREKEKTENLLLNILPAKVADELKTKGKVSPQHHDNVSILFTDFKNFTSIASKMSPEELVQQLETAFGEFDAIIERNGLYKIKTIGDAYMAVAGLVKPDPYHAFNAVNAGMEMQEFMDRWIGRQKRRGEEVWELRIGIHSGSVVSGVIGQQKFAYDIWGDAVNTASRMETNGEAGKVNISADTYELVRSYCEFEEKRTEFVKNKGPVDMYFVKEITARRKKPQPVKAAEKAKRRWF